MHWNGYPIFTAPEIRAREERKQIELARQRLRAEEDLPDDLKPNRYRDEFESKALIEDFLAWLDGRMPSEAIREFERERGG